MNIIKPDGESLRVGDLENGESFTVRIIDGECHLMDIIKIKPFKPDANSDGQENDASQTIGNKDT